MAINITPGVGPQNSDIASAVATSAAVSSQITASVPSASSIATAVAAPSAATIAAAVAAPSAATIAAAVAAPSASTIATSVAAAVPTLSQINTSVSTYASPYGGTVTNLGTQSLSGAATTFSSLGGYKTLRLYINGASAANSIQVRFNGDATTTNYYQFSPAYTAYNQYTRGAIYNGYIPGITVHQGQATATPNGFYLEIEQSNSGQYKTFKYWDAWTSTAGAGEFGAGIWNSTAAITSVSINSQTGSLSAGTAWMWGAA